MLRFKMNMSSTSTPNWAVGNYTFSGIALPVASVSYQGIIFTLLGGTGVADIPYICLKDSTGTFAWKTISVT